MLKRISKIFYVGEAESLNLVFVIPDESFVLICINSKISLLKDISKCKVSYVI